MYDRAMPEKPATPEPTRMVEFRCIVCDALIIRRIPASDPVPLTCMMCQKDVFDAPHVELSVTRP
jgi:hypothetical protein